MPDDDEYFALRKNFQIFGAIYEELVTGYVDPLNPETLMRTGIDAMLQNLDPYTNFFDEADNARIQILISGADSFGRRCGSPVSDENGACR